jgi:hypothetical protein
MGQGRPTEVATSSSRDAAKLSGPRRPHWRWHLVGAIVLLVGLAGSVVGATWWGGQVRRDQRAAFNDKSQALAATVGSTIRRDVDVTDGALKLLQIDPQATTADFQRWFDLIEAGGRYPGLMVFGASQVVSKADAPAVLAKLETDLA